MRQDDEVNLTEQTPLNSANIFRTVAGLKQQTIQISPVKQTVGDSTWPPGDIFVYIIWSFCFVTPGSGLRVGQWRKEQNGH